MCDTKTCSKCRRELPATTDYFYGLATQKDGLRPDCKRCGYIHKAAPSALQLFVWDQKLHAQTTGQKYCPSCHRVLPRTSEFWYRSSDRLDGLNGECVDCSAVSSSIYRESLPASERRARSKAQYQRNREQRLSHGRKYRQENPEYFRAAAAKRRALKLDQTPPDADLEAIAAIYTEAAELSEAFGIEYHVDHIVPLVAGGLHHEDNLQILTADENLSKGANPDWVQSPPVFRKHTKQYACGLVAVWHEGVFQGVTTNL